MANKVLLAYVATDVLFVVMGAIMLGFSVIVQNEAFQEPENGEQAARNLLYRRFPLTAGIVNAIFYFVTFIVTIPGIIMPTRTWLKVGGGMATFTSLFSLILGLYLWLLTLKVKEDFAPIWTSQPAKIQDLMQTSFSCCGYLNSSSPAFITDPTCPSPAAAALMRGCATPIASFANVFVDDIFTAVFGMCGVGGVLVLATACLLKDRKERERFRHIDEKTGVKGTF